MRKRRSACWSACWSALGPPWVRLGPPAPFALGPPWVRLCHLLADLHAETRVRLLVCLGSALGPPAPFFEGFVFGNAGLPAGPPRVRLGSHFLAALLLLLSTERGNNANGLCWSENSREQKQLAMLVACHFSEVLPDCPCVRIHAQPMKLESKL